jgi:hypothetical protein
VTEENKTEGYTDLTVECLFIVFFKDRFLNNVISYYLLTTNGREKNERHLMCKLLFFFVVELTCNNDDNSYFFLIVYQESVKHNAKIVLFYREINFEKIQIRLEM